MLNRNFRIFAAILSLIVCFGFVGAVSANLCMITLNKTQDLLWEETLNITSDALASTTGDHLIQIIVADDQTMYIGDLGFETTASTKSIVQFLQPNEFLEDELKICDVASVSFGINCTFYNATSGTNFIVNNETEVNLSSSSAGCFRDNTGMLSKNNYTVTAITDAGVSVTFADDAINGTLSFKYKAAVYNATNEAGANQMACTNANVVDQFAIGNDTFGFIPTNISTFDDVTSMVCSIDSKMSPTAPSSIDQGDILVFLTGSVLTGVGLYAASKLRRRKNPGVGS